MNQEELELRNWFQETKDEPLEAMASFFDKRIEGYEEHMSFWQKHYEWLAKLVPEGTEKLLDIGCGTGLELDKIFERFPQLYVTGVDLSEQMLNKLSEKHKNRNLSIIRANYFTYDLGEACYDVAISFETLHHYEKEKKKQVFARLCRSLKEGGVYLECDYIASSEEIERLCFEECARRRKRDGIPPDTFVHFDTPLTLEHEMQAMREAGFSKVELVGFLADDNTPMIRAFK